MLFLAGFQFSNLCKMIKHEPIDMEFRQRSLNYTKVEGFKFEKSKLHGREEEEKKVC